MQTRKSEMTSLLFCLFSDCGDRFWSRSFGRLFIRRSVAFFLLTLLQTLHILMLSALCARESARLLVQCGFIDVHEMYDYLCQGVSSSAESRMRPSAERRRVQYVLHFELMSKPSFTGMLPDGCGPGKKNRRDATTQTVLSYCYVIGSRTISQLPLRSYAIL
jgi:hypothetical protein